MEYIVKKVINGKAQYYFQYQGRQEYIGPYLPADLSSRLGGFFSRAIQSMTASLPDEAKKQFSHGWLTKIEDARAHMLCLRHEAFARDWLDFYTWFGIIFTYNSNRAEGSKVTRPEIEAFAFSRIRKPRTRTDREIFNSFRTLNFAFSKEFKWNMKSIKHAHALLLAELDPLIAGKWKKEGNTAPGNQPTAEPKLVPKAMKDLILWLKASIKKRVYPPILALQFYCRFEQIHPFSDGNGRVGRILLNALLNKFKYLPVIFFTGNHKEHCAAIAQSLAGRPAKLYKHFTQQLVKSRRELKGVKGM